MVETSLHELAIIHGITVASFIYRMVKNLAVIKLGEIAFLKHLWKKLWRI